MTGMLRSVEEKGETLCRGEEILLHWPSPPYWGQNVLEFCRNPWKCQEGG
jgi:hypothetical protein